MELRQLQHFTVLAEELHFTRAAGRLHIVQSALSTSIRTLERELGAPLVARGGRRIHLTEAGQAFLIEARRTLAAAEAARNAVASVQGLLSWTLALGYMPAPDSYDLPALLSRFHRAHPGVTLRLRNVPSTELIEEVRRRSLDLAFVSSPGCPPGGVQVRTVSSSTMPLACPAGHRLADEVSVSLEEVASEMFVDFVAGWGARVATDEVFRQNGVHRATAFEVNDIPLCLSLVEEGLGVAFVPPEVALTRPHLRYVTVEPAPVWHIGVAHLDPAQMSAAGRAMLDLVENHSSRGR